jgi:hypothetical protein
MLKAYHLSLAFDFKKKSNMMGLQRHRVSLLSILLNRKLASSHILGESSTIASKNR